MLLVGLCGMPLKSSASGFMWRARMLAFCDHSFRKSLNSMSNSKKQATNVFPVSIKEVEGKIAEIRGMEVIADADVASLYGVNTKRVNEAVRNNPEKFPPDYMFELSIKELRDLRSKISSTKVSVKSHNPTKVFSERGMYMLATILSGARAREVTFAIIETFYKVRLLKRDLKDLHVATDDITQSNRLKHFSEILTDIVMPDLETSETESSLEINFLIGKVKHSVKRVRKGPAQE